MTMLSRDKFDDEFLENTYQIESKSIRIIIIKVASSCNLDCSYCFWFRDQSVYQLPPVMKKDLLDKFISRLSEYLATYQNKFIKIIFHGGEPLLLKNKVFSYLCEQINSLNDRVKILFSVTTNGVLINDEWASVFKKYQVGVSVSLDGGKAAHDKNRLDLKGRPTYDKVIQGINCLQRNDVKLISILSVYTPGTSPRDLCQHFIDELGINRFDVLIPDFNHDDKKAGLVNSISKFYIELFDLWVDKYWARGVRIRILESLVEAIFFKRTLLPGIGICPTKVLCITSSGDMETYDALRINGSSEVATNLNIHHHQIHDIVNNEQWLNHLENSLRLPTPCVSCDIRKYCRGGNLIHRYSSENSYNNSSVYCEDLKNIYNHILSQKVKLVNLDMICHDALK